MKPTTNSTYDVRGANRLLPLLNSIGREIQERTEALDQLDYRIGRLSSSNRTDALLAQASAEAATQRRAITSTLDGIHFRIPRGRSCRRFT